MINLPFQCQTCGKRFLNLLGYRKHKCKETTMNINVVIRRLEVIVDDWQRSVEPTPLAFVVAHEFMHMCMGDYEHAEYLCHRHSVLGEGININDMLAWGLELATRLTNPEGYIPPTERT